MELLLVQTYLSRTSGTTKEKSWIWQDFLTTFLFKQYHDGLEHFCCCILATVICASGVSRVPGIYLDWPTGSCGSWICARLWKTFTKGLRVGATRLTSAASRQVLCFSGYSNDKSYGRHRTSVQVAEQTHCFERERRSVWATSLVRFSRTNLHETKQWVLVGSWSCDERLSSKVASSLDMCSIFTQSRSVSKI